MNRKKKEDPLFIDIKFEETLSKEQSLLVTLELMKNLIYQRRQIPLTFDTLKYELSTNSRETNENGDTNDENVEQNESGGVKMSLRERMKTKQDKARKRKNKEKFVKQASKFLKLFEGLEKIVKNVFLNDHKVKEVALVFGVTVRSPKEVYLIQLPKVHDSKDKMRNENTFHQRRMIRLFRTLVSEFQRLLSQEG